MAYPTTNLSFQTSTETALHVLGASNWGWSADELADLPGAYHAVDAASLRRAFAVCRSSTVLSLLGDQPRIEAALAPGRP